MALDGEGGAGIVAPVGGNGICGCLSGIYDRLRAGRSTTAVSLSTTPALLFVNMIIVQAAALGTL